MMVGTVPIVILHQSLHIGLDVIVNRAIASTILCPIHEWYVGRLVVLPTEFQMHVSFQIFLTMGRRCVGMQWCVGERPTILGAVHLGCHVRTYHVRRFKGLGQTDQLLLCRMDTRWIQGLLLDLVIQRHG